MHELWLAGHSLCCLGVRVSGFVCPHTLTASFRLTSGQTLVKWKEHSRSIVQSEHKRARRAVMRFFVPQVCTKTNFCQAYQRVQSDSSNSALYTDGQTDTCRQIKQIHAYRHTCPHWALLCSRPLHPIDHRHEFQNKREMFHLKEQRISNRMAKCGALSSHTSEAFLTLNE